MSHSPRVSIIMNCLNSSEHLREAMDSAMAQTFQDFEIIFWDNCSTDASPDIAKSYGSKVRYFRGEKIVPLGTGRNLAITQARGEFIAFLDCDDLWAPGKLAAQVALFDANPRIGLVTTDTLVFDGKRVLRRFFDKSKPGRGKVFADLIKRQWISMSSAVIRRSALAGLTGNAEEWNGGWFDESLNVCEEADVFYRIAHDWELDFVPDAMTTWRVHGSNTTFRKFAQFAEETRAILAKHRRIYPGYEAEHSDLVDLLTKRSAFEEGVALWQAGDGAAARDVVRPFRNASRKFQAFWFLSYMPRGIFNAVAKLYFSLPRIFHS